ncbi:MAG: branched-chain amino acid ABC transporter substrate-binding protein [Methyloglobulus sp.]|nr:branched-chain amino acid ABC transporter substrate-binding protein [Methyloglobulus sp.]
MRSIKMLPRLAWIIFIIFQLVASTSLFAKGKQVIKIAYLTQTQKVRPVLSNLDPVIENKGVLGAELAIEDSNTTGEYTKQKFSLEKFIVPVDGNAVDTFNKQIAKKYAFVVTNLAHDVTNKVADIDAAKEALLFDAATIDDALRNKECRANVLHLLPSRAMRADALAQYMMKKRWTKWFLVIGNTKEDKLYAEAIKRSAKKFNMNIVQEKLWEHTFDARKSAQADVAVFTQLEDDYDVLVVADEQGQFGEYLDYRTWMPRPVIGTQGLVATSWHRTHEQWGATQIQNRFKEKTGRWMEEQDYGAYLAVRAIGEAATRTKSNELNPIKDYLLSDQFTLQGYKGTSLSFRPWDHQLRQPVLLVAPRSLVAVAPIEGFLHPKTELDTLGYDQPETGCQWSKEQ